MIDPKLVEQCRRSVSKFVIQMRGSLSDVRITSYEGVKLSGWLCYFREQSVKGGKSISLLRGSGPGKYFLDVYTLLK